VGRACSRAALARCWVGSGFRPEQISAGGNWVWRRAGDADMSRRRKTVARSSDRLTWLFAGLLASSAAAGLLGEFAR